MDLRLGFVFNNYYCEAKTKFNPKLSEMRRFFTSETNTNKTLEVKPEEHRMSKYNYKAKKYESPVYN